MSVIVKGSSGLSWEERQGSVERSIISIPFYTTFSGRFRDRQGIWLKPGGHGNSCLILLRSADAYQPGTLFGNISDSEVVQDYVAVTVKMRLA